MIDIDIALAASKTCEVHFIKRRSCLFCATAAVRVSTVVISILDRESLPITG